MQEKNDYDIIVIGAVSAGLGASGAAATFGLRTLLIEKEDKKIGGDCLNYGCVPSKAILHIAAQFQAARKATRFGLTAEGKADWPTVIGQVHEWQNVIREHENAAYLRQKYEQMTVVLGTAKLTGKNEVTVNDKAYRARHIILATGSKPSQLDVPGRDQVALYNNETLFWELSKLPEQLLVVGGGPIGCEMAQAFQRLGSQVTIINKGDRLMEKEIPKISRILEEQLTKEGIVILQESEVTAFPAQNKATVKTADGERTLSCDAVLEAIGREVRIDKLGLEAANVQVKEGKIVTDERYRTTNPAIYAIGDAYGAEMFSHGAEMHNFDLFNNLLSPFKARHSLDHFSWVTFTEPSVATFGCSEASLKKHNRAYDKIEQSFNEDDRAIVAEYRYGYLELYVSKPQGLFRKVSILGGTMIAPEAGELIQELLLANVAGMSIKEITGKIYPYPVAARINQKALRGFRQQGLLTPFLKRVIQWVYRHAPW